MTPFDTSMLLVDRDLLAERVKILEARNAELTQLLAEIVELEPCRYDHHGCCQDHGLHEKPCPHERARQLLYGEEPK